MNNPFGAHLLIIDGAHMLRRSMYQPALRDLTTSTGIPSGAIFGFLQSLKSAINTLQASTVIVTWEGGHSERRKAVYNDYKVRDYSNEEPERDTNNMTDYEFYVHQLEWIQKILEVLAIPQLRVLGKEGDDVLFQACKLLRGQKTIVSEDADFFALIDDEISVFRPIKKVLVNKDNFQQVTGLPTPRHFLFEKVLLGDGSDNIPGVAKGVGSKTAQDVLLRIEDPKDITIQRIIQEAATFGKARYNKIVEAGESTIRRNLELIDISYETFDVVEMTQLANELEMKKYPNVEMANKLLSVLEFNPDNINYFISRLSRMTDFTLASVIDKSPIMDMMANSNSMFNSN